LSRNEAKVGFHASSVLKQPNSGNKTVAEAQAAFLKDLPSDWILYEEMSRAGHICHIRTCTLVTPITVFLFAGSSHMAYDPQFDGEEDGKYSL
jgi:glycine/serine hydroxymethyltransferase